MKKQTRDCPICRLTSHRGRCTACGNSRSIPLCPPVGETVVYMGMQAMEPLTVTASKLVIEEGELAHVIVEGWTAGSRMVHMKVRGPDSTPQGQRWNWKGQRT